MHSLLHSPTVMLACLLGTCVPRVAWGHEQLNAPPLRDNTNQKVAPCGGVGWGSHVTTLKPGDPLMMQWIETIHHPGWFRISFRAAESGDFNQTILAAKVDSMTGINNYAHTVTMPQILTDQGSVQLAFVMTDQPNDTMPYGYNEYSNCTDVILTEDPNAATPTPTPSVSPTPSDLLGTSPATENTPAPEASSTGSVEIGTTQGNSETNSGGCAASPALAPGWIFGMWAARLWRRKSRN